MPHTIRARSLAAAAALALLAAACGESPTAGVPAEGETPAPAPPAPSVEKPFYAAVNPLVERLIRAGVRPNTITTIGTGLVLLSALAYGLGHVRIGGLILPKLGIIPTTTGGNFLAATLGAVILLVLLGILRR